jgi:hypothetical protein
MNNTLIILWLSVSILHQGISQLTVSTSTDKNTYEYGETIKILGTVHNESNSTVTIIGNIQGLFFLKYFDDTAFHMTHLPAEIGYEIPPKTSYTSQYKIDPERLGLPNRDGVHNIVTRYRWSTETEFISIMDTISISAPLFDGGQVLVSYSIHAPPSDIQALRDNMNATILTTDTLEFINTISERWQTSGFILDSLVSQYENDPRIFDLYADREVFLDTLFVTDVSDRFVYPDEFVLYQNYPNPFNPATAIQYELPGRAFVNLTVYNVIGEKVVTLVNCEQEGGLYEIVWDASGLSSGVYYYQLRTENYIETKNMILIQ